MRVNPLVAFLFNIILPIGLMFPGNPYQHYFFLSVASIILLITSKLVRLMKFAAAYGILFGLSILADHYPSYGGQFFLIFIVYSMQFIPCLMMASLLIKDYSAGEIISSLEPLRLPKSFVVSLTILLRYIPTFRREFSYIKEAMRLRNVPYTIRRPVKSFEFFLVPQLFRCAILAEEITSAGLVKGITNPVRRSSYYDMRMGAVDYILCLILILGLVVFIWWR